MQQYARVPPHPPPAFPVGKLPFPAKDSVAPRSEAVIGVAELTGSLSSGDPLALCCDVERFAVERSDTQGKPYGAASALKRAMPGLRFKGPEAPYRLRSCG